MKRIGKILISLCALGVPMSVVADDESTTTNTDKDLTIPITTKNPRQGSAYESEFSCIYKGGSIYIEFTGQTGELTLPVTVSVYHNGTLITVQNPAAMPCVLSIGNTPGLYQILISVEGGDSYMGVFEIN